VKGSESAAFLSGLVVVCGRVTFMHCARTVLSPVSIQTQALAFLAVFIYATQAIAFEWKPGFKLV